MIDLPSMSYDIDPCSVMKNLMLEYPHSLPTNPKDFIEKYRLDDEDRFVGTVPYEYVAAFCALLTQCACELSVDMRNKEICSLAYDILFDDAFGHDCEEVVIATLIISNSVYTNRIDPYEMIDEYLTEHFVIEDYTYEKLIPYARNLKIEGLGI